MGMEGDMVVEMGKVALMTSCIYVGSCSRNNDNYEFISQLVFFLSVYLKGLLNQVQHWNFSTEPPATFYIN